MAGIARPERLAASPIISKFRITASFSKKLDKNLASSTLIQLVTIASTLAVIQEASVAATKAGQANAARSERRSGAMLPIPLI